MAPIDNTLFAVLAIGWSCALWNGLPLTADLSPIGFTGCALEASAEFQVGMALQASSATVTWQIPNQPILRGATFFEQALLLDFSAPNGIGAMSRGAMGVLQ